MPQSTDTNVHAALIMAAAVPRPPGNTDSLPSVTGGPASQTRGVELSVLGTCPSRSEFSVVELSQLFLTKARRSLGREKEPETCRRSRWA